MVILDKKYDEEDSFINSGPVKWFDQDKKARFSPAIRADFEIILRSADEIEKRLQKLKAPRMNRASNQSERKKSQIFALCDIIATIGPVKESHIAYYFERIGLPKEGVSTLLGLAKALGLLDVVRCDSSTLYYLPLNDSSRIDYHFGDTINLSAERAKVVAFLQKIPVGQDALRSVKASYAN